MKIAIVVQRYGLDIVGGAEYLARVVAEHLKEYHEIVVLTTCAKSYHTWKNEYEPGNELINGVLVKRFKNKNERDINKHRSIEDKVFYSGHDKGDEVSWVDESGPQCDDLISYIKDNMDEYYCFIYFTFRYYPSYYGIKVSGKNSLIVPLAENDPALNLEITKEIFKGARGIIYSTPEERELILRKVGFSEDTKIWDVVGCGVELPESTNDSEMPAEEKCKGRYILYLGRIEGSKGCYKLFEYYQRAAEELGDIPDLYLAGYDAIGIPKHDKIKYLGFVSESDKSVLLKSAKFLIMPSPYESLSLVTLESMAYGTPVLVNGECEVLKGHCLRSNAGLWYQNYDEFRECMGFLVSEERMRLKMGQNGKNYVKNNYNWDMIVEKYLRLLNKM